MMDLTKKVTALMSRSLTAVAPECPIEKLEKLFKRRAIHHIPVEDAQGKILGIVSTEDISRAQNFLPFPVAMTARHIMTVDPVRLRPNVPIGEALSIFLDNRFRALPVVDASDKLLGILTPYDFLEMILTDLPKSE